MPFPHNASCPRCRATKVCNFCGKDMDTEPFRREWAHRCTQGRCPDCHARICTPGGDISPGHGSGLTREQVMQAIENEKRDHGS